MARWLVVWTAAILTAIWYMGAAVLRGEPVASLLLAVWLIAAAFGRWTGGRRLVRLPGGQGAAQAGPRSRLGRRDRAAPGRTAKRRVARAKFRASN